MFHRILCVRPHFFLHSSFPCDIVQKAPISFLLILFSSPFSAQILWDPMPKYFSSSVLTVPSLVLYSFKDGP